MENPGRKTAKCCWIWIGDFPFVNISTFFYNKYAFNVKFIKIEKMYF